MIDNLTSLRFFAALWVVLFHLRSRIDVEFGQIIENGARGVDFFFILSGFVMWHVYGGKPFCQRSYLFKRIARIYPLHLVLLVMFLFFDQDLHGFVMSAAMVHSFGTTDGLVLNGPSWTLSAEMFAYAIFALLASGPTLRMWHVAMFGIITGLVAHLYAIDTGRTGFIHLTSDGGWLRILPEFCIGIMLAMVQARVTTALGTVMFFVGLFGVVSTALLPLPDYAFVPAFALIILGAARADLPGLSSRFMIYLGEISYSIYLTHILVMLIWFHFRGDVSPTVDIIAVLILTMILSSCSYHLIERPARAWLNGLAVRPK